MIILTAVFIAGLIVLWVWLAIDMYEFWTGEFLP